MDIKSIKHGMLSILALSCTMHFSAAHAQDGDPGTGEGLYALCAGCHGSDAMGLESTSAPRLQGQFDWYLIRQLQNFKSGARGSDSKDTLGATMRAMAGTLQNEQAIKDVVAYIGTLEAVSGQAEDN